MKSIPKDIRNAYPISWITESRRFTEYFHKIIKASEDDLLVADFASGEYDRVPSFFSRELPKLVNISNANERRIVVYCTDIHELRLESLFGKLREERSLNQVRCIHTSLEDMERNAKFISENIEFVNDHPEVVNWLDDFLIGEEQFPPECIDIGILNNDVIGYLHDYYTEYSDAEKSLESIWRLIRPKGILIVTMPCLQYQVDNISILEKVGFSYIEGIDIVLSSGTKILLEKHIQLDQLSMLNHYTFFVFSRR
jgi:SAM-dependent methyltransferase